MSSWCLWIPLKQFSLEPVCCKKQQKKFLTSYLTPFSKKNDKVEWFFCLIKSSRIISIFYVHFTWLYYQWLLKDFFLNSHFENMTASFILRCQNLLRYFIHETTHFQACKKYILTNNNVIKEYPPNVLENWLCHQIFVFWARDPIFWLQLCFFKPVKSAGSDFT